MWDGEVFCVGNFEAAAFVPLVPKNQGEVKMDLAHPG